MDVNIQLRTVRAFNMVSAVVIVLDTTTTRVDSASSPKVQWEGEESEGETG